MKTTAEEPDTPASSATPAAAPKAKPKKLITAKQTPSRPPLRVVSPITMKSKARSGKPTKGDPGLIKNYLPDLDTGRWVVDPDLGSKCYKIRKYWDLAGTTKSETAFRLRFEAWKRMKTYDENSIRADFARRIEARDRSHRGRLRAVSG